MRAGAWGDFTFMQCKIAKGLFSISWSGLPKYQLLAEMNGKRQFVESESVSIYIVFILLFLRFWGQCLKRCVTRKYSQ